LLELARREDDVRSDHFAHHFLADCALIRRRLRTADDRYRRSLLAALPLGDAIETSFEIQAWHGRSRARHPAALRLGGAAADLGGDRADDRRPVLAGLLDTVSRTRRESLPPERGAAAWEAGREPSFERAVEEALEPASQIRRPRRG
jgi:hypothetical protein